MENITIIINYKSFKHLTLAIIIKYNCQKTIIIFVIIDYLRLNLVGGGLIFKPGEVADYLLIFAKVSTFDLSWPIWWSEFSQKSFSANMSKCRAPSETSISGVVLRFIQVNLQRKYKFHKGLRVDQRNYFGAAASLWHFDYFQFQPWLLSEKRSKKESKGTKLITFNQQLIKLLEGTSSFISLTTINLDFEMFS